MFVWDPIKGRSIGRLWSTTRRAKSCAIPATPALSATGARIPANVPMGRFRPHWSPRSCGRFSSERPILVTSAGKSTKPTCASCEKIVLPTEKIAATAPHVKDQRGSQGIIICGRCGQRMTVRYHETKGGKRLYPEYLCQKEQIEQADNKFCQRVDGAGLHVATADLLLAQLTPLAVETSLQIHEELQAQVQETQRLRAQQVERARYAAELAQRRFLRVDPENRLVADVLEADWNARLRELAEVQEQAERQQEAEQRKLSALEQQAIADLVEDFPRVWKDSRTSDRDRKRLVRLLLTDVTVLRQEEVIAVHVRFKGGAQQSITVPLSRGRRSTPELIALIDQLLDDYTDAEVAEQLTQRGWRTYEGKPFSAARVLSLRRYQQLKDHGTRLAERGLLSADEAASAYGVCRQTIMAWGRAGLLPMYRINDQGTAVFPPPDEHAPVKNAHKYQTTRSSCGRSAVCN